VLSTSPSAHAKAHGAARLAVFAAALPLFLVAVDGIRPRCEPVVHAQRRPSRPAVQRPAVDGARRAPSPAAAAWPEPTEPSVDCNEQRPIDYLVRANFLTKGRLSPEELRHRRQNHARAIEFRTRTYGYFAPFGQPEWNPRTPMEQASTIRLFGLRVRVHEKIVPALRCAEREVASACASTPYQPRRLSGIRDRNTYRGGEVSNHVYGIALDIDPTENTCCGCVPPWSDHPLCKREVASIYERMVMPECWVRGFEKFGFYWLGRDVLQDTMHFEFLGDPDRIVR
jgi:hypothetical protein